MEPRSLIQCFSRHLAEFKHARECTNSFNEQELERKIIVFLYLGIFLSKLKFFYENSIYSTWTIDEELVFYQFISIVWINYFSNDNIGNLPILIIK